MIISALWIVLIHEIWCVQSLHIYYWLDSTLILGKYKAYIIILKYKIISNCKSYRKTGLEKKSPKKKIELQVAPL